MASRELIWLRRLLNNIHNTCEKATDLQTDNQSAIKLVKNPEFHKRTKHVDIHFHFIRERFAQGDLCVKYIKSEEQCADFLTKALPKERYRKLLSAIGMCNYKA